MKLASIAQNLIASLGYGGLDVGLVVDSAGVPIPSEILLPLAGSLDQRQSPTSADSVSQHRPQSLSQRTNNYHRRWRDRWRIRDALAWRR